MTAVLLRELRPAETRRGAGQGGQRRARLRPEAAPSGLGWPPALTVNSPLGWHLSPGSIRRKREKAVLGKRCGGQGGQGEVHASQRPSEGGDSNFLARAEGKMTALPCPDAGWCPCVGPPVGPAAAPRDVSS